MAENLEIIQQNKSAFYGSSFQMLCNAFAEQTHKTFSLREGKDANITKLRKALKSLEKKTLTAKDEKVETGLERIEINGDGKEVVATLTVGLLQTMWANQKFQLPMRWVTPAEFIKLIIPAFKDYKHNVIENRKQVAEMATDATRLIYESGVKRETKWAYLGTTWAPRLVNEADQDFLYSHLRQSCGAFYWLHEGESLPLPRAEKTGEITQDPCFWALWERSCTNLLDGYLKTVIETAEQLRLDHPVDEETGLPMETVDAAIGKLIPRIIVRNLALGCELRSEVGEENGKAVTRWKFERFRLSVKRLTKSAPSIALEDWEQVLASEMVKGLSMEHIKEIKQFSNVAGEALCCVSLDGVDVSGAHGADLARSGAEPPELPPTWSRFLCGADGKTSIFESDPQMCLLRLAWFVVQVVQDNECKCRQILCLSGSGNDGKSVAVDLISDLVGKGAVALKADKLNDDSQTYPALNRALICLPECKKPSEIFRSPFVKSVTGGDVIALRRLYEMPIQWRPEHTRILMTTNARTYVSNENEVSRLLPLAFHRNYKPSEQQTVEWFRSRCMAERELFLQWCFDMLGYYKTITNAAGGSFGVFKANGLSIITDEAYKKWLDGELTLDDSTNWDSLIKAAIENCGTGRFHVTLSEETSEDEEELFKRVCDLLFEFTGNSDDRVSRVEIVEALQNAAANKMSSANKVVLTLGLHGDSLTRKNVYASFLKYINSQPNIEELKTNGARVFKGLKLKQVELGFGGDDEAVE